MRIPRWSRDRISFLILAILIGGMGWIQVTQPNGLSLASATGGLITLDTMTRVGLFTIVLVGLNLLMGYAGQVTLGQAAFYGMGAFFSAIMTTRVGKLGMPVEIMQAWWYPVRRRRKSNGQRLPLPQAQPLEQREQRARMTRPRV